MINWLARRTISRDVKRMIPRNVTRFHTRFTTRDKCFLSRETFFSSALARLLTIPFVRSDNSKLTTPRGESLPTIAQPVCSAFRSYTPEASRTRRL